SSRGRFLCRRTDHRTARMTRFLSPGAVFMEVFMVRSRLVWALAMVVILVPGLRVATEAQVCAPLQGKVFDSQGWGAKPRDGVALNGVLVKIVNENNGNTRSRLTQDNGVYKFPCLPPGYYKITASLSRFDQRELRFRVQLIPENVIQPRDISLTHLASAALFLMPGSTNVGPGSAPVRQVRQAGLIWRVPGIFPDLQFSPDQAVTEITRSPRSGLSFLAARLSLGGPATPHDSPALPPGQGKVTVPAPAPPEEAKAQLVHTLDITRGSNFSQQQILSLPLGGAAPMRSFDELVLLVPGISPPPFTPGVRG